MYILNFSHPLTEQNLNETRQILTCLADEPITVINIPVQIDRSVPIGKAAKELLTDIPWEAIGDQVLLVNPPGLAPAAVALMEALSAYGVTSWLNIRPVNAVAGVATRYEVAEVITDV